MLPDSPGLLSTGRNTHHWPRIQIVLSKVLLNLFLLFLSLGMLVMRIPSILSKKYENVRLLPFAESIIQQTVCHYWAVAKGCSNYNTEEKGLLLSDQHEFHCGPLQLLPFGASHSSSPIRSKYAMGFEATHIRKCCSQSFRTSLHHSWLCLLVLWGTDQLGTWMYFLHCSIPTSTAGSLVSPLWQSIVNCVVRGRNRHTY